MGSESGETLKGQEEDAGRDTVGVERKWKTMDARKDDERGMW